MPEVKEKKVELIELFYDLIYVYAISQMTLIVAIGALVVLGFMDSPYGFLFGSLIATGGNFYLFWHKYSSNRCINPLHHI